MTLKTKGPSYLKEMLVFSFNTTILLRVINNGYLVDYTLSSIKLIYRCGPKLKGIITPNNLNTSAKLSMSHETKILK